MLEASLPPFRSKAFPLAIARADTWKVRGAQCDQSFNDVKMQTRVKSHEWSLTCGRQSGRDSKMTSRTPMGTVI